MNNTKQQIVYETRAADMGLGSVLRFNIPSSIQLINNQETYLKFNVVVNSAGFNVLDPPLEGEADVSHWYPWTTGKGGMSNLIKNLIIKTADGVTVETITDYNRLNRVLCNYTLNSTEHNLNNLYAGADTEKVTAINTLTRRNIASGGGESATEQSQSNQTIEVCLPLKLSGIFSNPNPYPNLLAPLQIEIQLEEDAFNVVHAQSYTQGGDDLSFMNVKDLQNVAGGYTDDFVYRIDGDFDTANMTYCDLITVDSGLLADFIETGAIDNTNFANHPFWPGQVVIIESSNGDEQVTIDKVSHVNGKLRLTFQDTLEVFTDQTNEDPKIYIDEISDIPTITLSNIQMVVGSVDPSPQQLQAMSSAIKKGYSYNFRSWYDFPVNIGSNVNSASNLINCKFRRCKAILSYIQRLDDATSVLKDNLMPEILTTLNPINYQYKLGGLLVPNRKVDTSRYVRTRAQVGGWSAVHVKELEQGLACCGLPLKDLSNIDGGFLMARGLVTRNSGFTYDMSGNEESRFNINFGPSGNTKNTMNHNVVCHLKTLVITESGKFIDE